MRFHLATEIIIKQVLVNRESSRVKREAGRRAVRLRWDMKTYSTGGRRYPTWVTQTQAAGARKLKESRSSHVKAVIPNILEWSHHLTGAAARGTLQAVKTMVMTSTWLSWGRELARWRTQCCRTRQMDPVTSGFGSHHSRAQTTSTRVMISAGMTKWKLIRNFTRNIYDL